MFKGDFEATDTESCIFISVNLSILFPTEQIKEIKFDYKVQN